MEKLNGKGHLWGMENLLRIKMDEKAVQRNH